MLFRSLMGREARVDAVTRAGGRNFWRLRTPGFIDYAAARQFCDELKLAGRDCFVSGLRGNRAATTPRREPIAPAASITPATLSPEG